MGIPLPGVYTNIKDLSALPQGRSGVLSVGIILQSNKGPIGQISLQTSPTDLLTSYTFKGAVGPSDDKSFYTALNTLRQTSLLYTARAYSVIDPPLYGGLIVKKEDTLGNITSVVATTDSESASIVVAGTVSVSQGDDIRIYGTSLVDGRYTVGSVTVVNQVSTIVVNEAIDLSYNYVTGTQPVLYLTRQPIPFNNQLLGAITAVASTTLTLAGDVTDFFLEGDQIKIEGSTDNDGIYKVVSAVYDNVSPNNETHVSIATPVPNVHPTHKGNIFRSSIANPDNYAFQPEDLFILTGADQGSYNGNIKISITSSTESPDSITESNVMQIVVYNAATKMQLEQPYLCNRIIGSKATNGISLFIQDVLTGSSFIKAINNPNALETLLPCNTHKESNNDIINTVQMSGGYDGSPCTTSDMINVLNLFEDKVTPIDIMANGSGALAESVAFQTALINLAETRQDIVAFLNTPLQTEQLPTNSARAAAISNYKKGLAGSTSFYSAMYAPHVTIPDTFNSRQISVGADALIIPGWLNVINTQGYPFAYAGPQYGQLSNMTAAWRIGDESGEAATLNNSSVNFIAYDSTQGSYVAWTQNTLQIANSAMRNLGAVFNVLDIKKTLSVYLKQYLQLPITNALRKSIASNVNNYMDGIKASNRVSGYIFQDISSSTDISNNTLRFILTISPAYYAQQIYLTVAIVNQTLSFQILQTL